MTLIELRRLQDTYAEAERTYQQARKERNALIRQLISDGATHQWISDATGLSRGRISQIVK